MRGRWVSARALTVALSSLALCCCGVIHARTAQQEEPGGSGLARPAPPAAAEPGSPSSRAGPSPSPEAELGREDAPPLAPATERLIEGEDPRLPRPSSWLPVVARSLEGGPSIAVFEAPSRVEAARDDLVREFAAVGYRLGPVVAADTRGFVRGDLRVVAVFAPLAPEGARVTVALIHAE